MTETERYPAHALVEALKGRTVVDASCDGEGVDDVRLLLDNGTAIMIDSELDTSPNSIAMAQARAGPPWPRLSVRIGGRGASGRSTTLSSLPGFLQRVGESPPTASVHHLTEGGSGTGRPGSRAVAVSSTQE